MSALSSTEARAGDAPIAVIAESLSWDLSGDGRAAIRGYVPRDDSPSQAARYAGRVVLWAPSGRNRDQRG